MSLIVLNSRGQDPAEFENHGFNLKLGRDTQFCLCGVNLNRPPKTPLQLAVTTGTNNMWIVANGGKLQNDAKIHSPIYFSLREGVYGIAGMAAEMTYAMNGNYEGKYKDNYAGMPISCWRANTADPLTGGLQVTQATAAGVTKYSAVCSMTKIVNGMRTRLSSVFGAAGGGSFPQPTGNQVGQIPTGIPDAGFIFENAIDSDYISVRPSISCKNFICLDPLWNTSNDATLTAFSGAGAIPADGTNDGWTWGCQLEPAPRPNTYIGKLRGGIISSKWTGGVTAGGCGLQGSTNSHGPQSLQGRWAVGGNRYDIYWEVGERSSAATGFQIQFYSCDMTKGPNVKNNITTDSLWGSLTIPPIAAGGNFWEVCMRPIQVGAGSYKVEAWCRERATAGGAQVGAALPATQGGAVGYYELNDTTNALYQNLPLFQGMSYNEETPAASIWNFRSIHHNARPGDGFAATTSLIPFSSAAAAVNNAAKISCCFSPISPNFQRNPLGGGPTSTNPLRYDMIEAAHRHSGIAPVIGFQIGNIQEMPQATTAATGVEGDNGDKSFQSSEPVAVIQLPNIPLHGELGSGSTIWGGSNGGQVLGVAQLEDEGSNQSGYNLGMNSYTEPGLENWIDCGNLGVDALNQLKVKITDQQGRKLVGLFPDSTIWLKVRSSTQGAMRTGGTDQRGSENRSSW